ncbi:MAG TPA: TonB-dependent receptor, partial [Terriglobales bacterium]|nr:TonB-dependent receptor [Terriglobales bacterium]
MSKQNRLCHIFIFPSYALHLIFLCLSMFLTVSLCAQVEIGRLTGTVNDPSGARVTRANVSLINHLTGRQIQTSSDAQGQFHIDNIPYGPYILRVTASGFATSTQSVTVRSNIAVQITVPLAIASAGSEVTVHSDLIQADSPRTETVIDESVIKLAPTVVRRDQLQALISTTPGWNTENDGLMHIRGVDDGTLYVVDGVPMPDRVDGLFAGSFNTDAITSMDVITGNIPAEYGDKSGAVVIIQPKSGYRTPLNGTLGVGGGSFDSRDISTTLGGGTDKWGLFFAGTGHQSDRFLDPVDPRNFNNTGGDVSLDIRADWHPTEKDILRLAGAVQGGNFHVPNNADQQDAGQDQRQQVRHDHESLSWQHTFSPNTLFDVGYFRNFFRASLLPSEFDTPITAEQNRHQTRQGAHAGYFPCNDESYTSLRLKNASRSNRCTSCSFLSSAPCSGGISLRGSRSRNISGVMS